MTATTTAATAPFQRFLDEHRGPVLAFLRAMVGHHDADDCFQETFMSALRNYESLDGQNPRAWVLTIARNKAIDHYRARERRAVPVANVPEQPAPEEPDHNDELWQAVAGLPERQRAAVALRFAGDLRFREVGEAIDCSEEAARRNVHDGLKNLRKAIGVEGR